LRPPLLLDLPVSLDLFRPLLPRMIPAFAISSPSPLQV
jgi:hypothetical protein